MFARALLAVSVALAVAPALTTPAQAFDDPGQMVRGLYRQKTIPDSPARIDRYFAHDLAAAMRKDSSVKDEVGAIDFDYRYGAQDWKITGLTFAEAKSPAGAEITARFRNFGKANTVVWRMCKARDGWRVADVAGHSAEDTWALRDLLKMPKGPVAC